MKNFIAKLQSRKFLTCVAGVVMGVCMIFGLETSDVNTIAGAVVAVGSVVTYIYTEGKIDEAAVDKIKDAVDKVEDAFEAVGDIEN